MGKMSRRAKKLQNSAAPMSSGDEGPVRKAKAKPGKRGRKWDADGLADEGEDVQLDYSAPNAVTSDSEFEAVGRTGAVEEVDASTWGSTTKGKFVLKDLGDEVHSILAQAGAKGKTETTAPSGLVTSGLSAIGGLFRNVVGGKVLTKEDLDKAMKGMEEHLLKKNVAREAAVRLCEGVEKELVGMKTGSFESKTHGIPRDRGRSANCCIGINARIQTAMEASLTKMLTPTSSLDLLREIDSITAPSATSLRKARPYVISIVGVNGVGKSTNLSKICFFLLQNKYKVLIAAGDTFRSGAVEQLAVHVRRLKELTAREGGQVELYQKGYGKDAAAVAKDAVSFAAREGFDVVLIDTAGRRHNDQRLMASLEKFAKFAQPDKILMVGEVSTCLREDDIVPMLTWLGSRGYRLGGAGEKLQRGVWVWSFPRWLHHLQVRHGWRHGGNPGQHCTCDQRARVICRRWAALLGLEEFLGQVGGREAVEQHKLGIADLGTHGVMSFWYLSNSIDRCRPARLHLFLRHRHPNSCSAIKGGIEPRYIYLKSWGLNVQ